MRSIRWQLSECFSYRLTFPSFFHHIIFPKERLWPFRGWVVLQERRRFWEPIWPVTVCSSPGSFTLAVEKGSIQNSASNLEERNSVSRCAKCISVAPVALTQRFWCMRAVLGGFNQPSSNTVTMHSCVGSNLHSVMSQLITPNQKHDLMLNEYWYLTCRPKLISWSQVKKHRMTESNSSK